GLEVLDEDVGFLRQAADEVLADRAREIDGDGTLAAIHREEGGGLARLPALPVLHAIALLAHVVAAPRPLDLDHVRTEIGEHLRRPRAGEDAAQIENPRAG